MNNNSMTLNQAKQKVLIGTLSELASLAEHAQSPSLIVIGEVVSLSSKLSWFSSQDKQQNSTQPIAI